MAKEDEDAKSEPKVADPSAHPIAIGKNHAPEEDPLLLGSKNEVKERKCPFSHMAGMLPNPHVETPDAPEPLIGKTTLGEAMAVSPIHPDDNSPRFKGKAKRGTETRSRPSRSMARSSSGIRLNRRRSF